MDETPAKASKVPGADDLSGAQQDLRWMQCALALARQGVGLASPNPTVGCVIVRENRIVGQGFHEYLKILSG